METVWLTTTEAAALMRVSRQTISRWIREGQLPAKRIGVGQRSIYRVSQRDLAEFARRYITYF
jgi:excisionase family DNA binding protein